ncbi:MAG: Eco57I restriction-modification methylase domain-containing protein [Bacteroidota bacterium]
MLIFQKSIVKKHINSINQELLKEKWNLFTSYFHNATIQENIHHSKEEQFQEGFLRELFVKVLGYTLNPEPNFNLTTEYKNIKDSKKADGAIIINNTVTAVIELKGTGTTDLGKVESQAFNYKNNQHQCVYVITSNFEKLRFYIDNAIEHIEFNLFKLTEEEFQLLYLCLAYKNIENNVPKNIKDESVSQEDVITKKLYNDYSLFKRELHHNLVALNPGNDPLELFQKSQKLLDRFLFIFFAEDRGLLPTNLIFRINKEWQQLREMRIEVSLYDRYKIYFSDLNVGAKVSLPAFSQTAANKKEEFQIYAYNGGLFKEDEALNTLKIDDALLFKHTEKLSNYDFASEVDVNILGHIFENSLNDVDELAKSLANTIDDSSPSGRLGGASKRKKDGVFYTPKYITKYIVDNTVGKLCHDKKVEFKIIEEEYITDKKRNKTTIQNLATKLTDYRNWLLQITICDPACGSGAFLNQALDFLINEHRYIDELRAKLFGDALILSDVEQSILENNIFGVDINEESVEIAKISLWLRTAQPNRKLNDLNSNIKCGNSLIDDVAVAGDKAFNWYAEFQQVFPRYKGTKNYIPVNDRIINPKINNGDELGKYKDDGHGLLNEFHEPPAPYSYKRDSKGFENGGFDVIIGNPPYVSNRNILEKDKLFYKINYKSAIDQYDLYVLFMELLNKITKNNGLMSYILPDKFLVSKYGEGVLEFLKNKIIIESYWDLTDENVFVDASVYPIIFVFRKFQNDNLTMLSKKDFEIKSIKEILNNIFTSLILKIESVKKINFKVWRPLATSKNIIDGNDLVVSNNSIGKYFAIPKTNKTSNGSRDYDKVKNKIILKKLCYNIEAFYDEHGLVPINTTYCITTNSELTTKYLLTLLNSKLLSFYARKKYINTALSGGYIELRVFQVELLPIIETAFQNSFIEKGDLMLSLNKELQELSQKFQRALQRKFELENLPKKLEDWYLLSFSDFIKELTKKKIKLSLSDEAEWEEYFNTESKKALELKSKIDATDKEIDQMVYKLYDLTEEEIKIVEG